MKHGGDENVKPHKSIRTQFALIFILLVAAMLIVWWIINSLFLQSYYLKNKQRTIVEAYDRLNVLLADYGGEEIPESIGTEITSFCSDSNISVAVVSSAFDTVFTSEHQDDLLIKRLMDHLFSEDISEMDSDYEIKISEDKRIMRSDNMELWGTLGNGDMVIMRTPIESIRESVAISNRFYTYIGIILAVISGIIIWIVTGRITRPVRELTDISDKMARMDFDAKYTGGSNNEIGLLGNHINEMSEHLKKAISDLKTANNELQRDIEKKEKLDGMRLEFLSNVAHELKTPIALIQGYTEGLKDNLSDDAETRDFYCEVIIDEANKMNKLVKNLTTLNQLEFGNDEISMERFDIAELIKNHIISSDIMLKQNAISVSFEAEGPLYVWGDEFKIEEVFTNYFSNAIHYCKEVKGGTGKRIDIKTERAENTLKVTVFNTGEPIPEESLDRLWDKFYKVDRARTHEYGGSGIGLSIVRAIMEAHNKRYGVENYENGVGFYFELDCGEEKIG